LHAEKISFCNQKEMKKMVGRKGRRVTWRRGGAALASMTEEGGFAGDATVEAGGWRRDRRGKERAVERRERPTMALGGRLMVVLASCGSYGGGQANGNVVRRLERQRERGRVRMAETGLGRLVFG
jgi:hypothetical protein